MKGNQVKGVLPERIWTGQVSRRIWALFAATGLFAMALAFSALSDVTTAEAAATDIGYRDFSYEGASAPTGQKPQSKLWFNDGIWWGSLFSAVTGKHQIHRLDWTSQAWVDTGIVIDSRNFAQTDALWDGTHLYVASAVRPGSTTSDPGAYVSRYSYDPSAESYALDPGFPVLLGNVAMEAIVIGKDTTGKLWVTYTDSDAFGGRSLYITHTSTDDLSWITPYTPPVTGATNLAEDDISTLVAFNSKMGVMWSNQNEDSVYFISHNDGAPDDTWSQNPALQGPKYADDHLNIKSLQADPSGQVFAVVKTSRNDLSPSNPNDPLILLLVLQHDSSWSRHTFSTVADNHTRPIVLLDPEHRKLYVFAASPCCSGGTIFYKRTSLDEPSFESGLGIPFIQTSVDTVNNPTSTKQPLNSATGLVVLAGSDKTKYYLHNSLDLSADDTTPPDTTIDSGPSGTVTDSSATFEFSSTEAHSSFECRLDNALFSPCTSPKSYSDLTEGSHTFEVRAIDIWGNIDSSPASRTWTFDDPAETLIFNAEADAYVSDRYPDRNYGTATSLQVDGSPRQESYLRFTVSGVSGTIQSAKLRVYTYNGSGNGPAAYSANNEWGETSVTWNTRPARTSAASDDKGAISTESWTEYDVAPLVAGDGTYTFNLASDSSDGTFMYSREGNSPPTLVLKVLP